LKSVSENPATVAQLRKGVVTLSTASPWVLIIPFGIRLSRVKALPEL
jgi:hypothetical protein